MLFSRGLGFGDKVLFPGSAYAGSVTVYTENRENFEVIKSMIGLVEMEW